MMPQLEFGQDDVDGRFWSSAVFGDKAYRIARSAPRASRSCLGRDWFSDATGRQLTALSW